MDAAWALFQPPPWRKTQPTHLHTGTPKQKCWCDCLSSNLLTGLTFTAFPAAPGALSGPPYLPRALPIAHTSLLPSFHDIRNNHIMGHLEPLTILILYVFTNLWKYPQYIKRIDRLQNLYIQYDTNWHSVCVCVHALAHFCIDKLETNVIKIS